MRWVSLAIVVILLHDVFAPHWYILGAPQNKHPNLTPIDICHASALAVTEDDEAACISDWPYSLKPALSFDYLSFTGPVFTQVLFTSRDDRPPEA